MQPDFSFVRKGKIYFQPALISGFSQPVQVDGIPKEVLPANIYVHLFFNFGKNYGFISRGAFFGSIFILLKDVKNIFSGRVLFGPFPVWISRGDSREHLENRIAFCHRGYGGQPGRKARPRAQPGMTTRRKDLRRNSCDHENAEARSTDVADRTDTQ